MDARLPEADRGLVVDLPAAEPRVGGVARLLLAEDDGHLRRLLTRFLARQGYEVTAVEDGAAAWEALRGGQYDLLITDLSMPRLSGLDLVARLREAGVGIPVILTTGLPPADAAVRFPRLRITAVLEKPFSVLALKELVGSLLQRAGPGAVG